MADIFGEPNWLALAGGILSDLFRGFLEALNLFLLVVPFGLSGSIASHLASKNVPRWVIVPVAVLTFVLPLASYYIVYPYIGFPYWMRWLHH
jgi:hypothetical protein